MGWAIVIGCTKRQFQIANLLEVDSKLEFLKNKHLPSCNVSKCPYGNKSFYFFQCLLKSLCFFKKKFESLCFSNFMHMFTCNFIRM